MLKKNPVRSDGKPPSENKASVRFLFYGLRVVAVSVVECGNEVPARNRVRSDGKPRSENKASATVRSVLYAVLVREEHDLRVIAVCVVEHAHQVFTFWNTGLKCSQKNR